MRLILYKKAARWSLRKCPEKLLKHHAGSKDGVFKNCLYSLEILKKYECSGYELQKNISPKKCHNTPNRNSRNKGQNVMD